ncbi:unnamed protein product [Trifolium pratense]|uniref:Uncharacterized protein n=1 Tax=Trifolium pratense TaxID=57577 RepID=A0ACB0J324_TRIPR|nr:unnamed protein product [Trifolium pratense]
MYQNKMIMCLILASTLLFTLRREVDRQTRAISLLPSFFNTSFSLTSSDSFSILWISLTDDILKISHG